MCNYIKDNGEQCGMDTEPFCRHHEDSDQAAEWNGSAAFPSEATAGAQSDFDGAVMENHCEECETPLRRTERLREHPNVSRRTTVEAVVECDCSERIIANTSMLTEELPDGWGL
ncbi:hypothetical protein HAPG_00030 [Halorubrum phage GNf2]|nr:hypothetical protein HAPG_00030 [Halorubrum phage GNf2]